MWSLRRAANPLRRQSHRVMGGPTCCIETNILIGSAEHGGVGLNHAPRGCTLPVHEHSSSASSFLWSRNLSSHAGAKSSDDEDELENGFSDLEATPEIENAEDVEIEDEDVVVSEGDITEKESDDIAETEGILGLSDVETESNKEKRMVIRRVASSPLSKLLLETPQQSIKSALDQWVNEGKPLGREEIYSAIFNLRKRKLFGKALQLLGWVKENNHLDFTARDYASHLDLIAKVKGIQKAEKYIEKVPEPFRAEFAYRTLLANSVAMGSIKKSEEIYNKIRDLGFPLTTFVCNQLLLLYKRHDRKKIADVLKMMEKEDVKPSLFTYRLLIDTKGRANDVQGMEDLVGMMKEGGVEPDLHVKAMLAKYYSFAKLDEKAEAMLREIEGGDVEKNRDACREVLRLYATLGKEGDVERVWKVCEGNPRLEECIAAIEAWGRLGKVEKAEGVFEHVMKTWKKVSGRVYNSMLKVYANHRLLSKGKELGKRMSEKGCRMGPLTWDALVRLYVEAGEVEMGESILEKAVRECQMKPMYSSYVVLLESYAKRGDVHKAEKMFHKLRQSGYGGRMRMYQTLLRAYVNGRVPAYGYRERMRADNMFPNKELAEQLAAVDPFKKKTVISELLS